MDRRPPVPPKPVLAGVVVLAASLAVACASGGAPPGDATAAFAGDLDSAVNAALAAAPACGLQLMRGGRDEAKGTAFLVLLDEWQNPQPESALVTLRFEPAEGRTACRLEAHPLAEHGMKPQDIGAGSEWLVCQPCADARRDIPLARYSQGLAFANAARASRCLREALEPDATPDRSSDVK